MKRNKKVSLLAMAMVALSATAGAAEINRIVYHAPILFAVSNNISTNTTQITTNGVFNPIVASPGALLGLPMLSEGGAGTSNFVQGTVEGGKVVTDPLASGGLKPLTRIAAPASGQVPLQNTPPENQ